MISTLENNQKADTERLREIQDVLFLWANMMYQIKRANTGWFRIRIMCSSGATYLSTDVKSRINFSKIDAEK